MPLSWRSFFPTRLRLALCLGLILIGALFLRARPLDDPYLLDFHSWRQTDSAAFTHGYLIDSFNPFDPSIDRYPCEFKHEKFGRVEAELPLYAWLPAVPLKLMGVKHPSVPYLRVWYLAYFVATCLFLFALVREFGGDETDATLTVAAFSFLPVAIPFARSVQPDGPSLLCAAAFLLFLSRACRADRKRRELVAAGLAGALLLLTKISNAYVAVPAVAVVLSHMSLRQALRDKGLWFVLACVLAPNVAWYAHARSFAWTFGVWADGADNKFTNQKLLFNAKEWKHLLTRVCWEVLTAGGFALAMIGAGADSESRRQRIALVWTGAAMFYIVATLNGQLRHVYYQLCLALPVAFLVAKGVRSLWNRDALARAVLAVCLVVHAATTYGALYSTSNGTPFYSDGGGFRGVLPALSKHVPEDSLIVSATRDPRVYFNSGRRGYFTRASWPLLSKCMEGTSEWLLLEPSSEKQLQKSLPFMLTMTKVWSDKHFSLWRKRPQP